jgi:hypothetical protein
MRETLKICLQYPKHGCKYVSYYYINVSSFKFKTYSKCALVHIWLSSAFALALLVAYDAPASYSSG